MWDLNNYLDVREFVQYSIYSGDLNLDEGLTLDMIQPAMLEAMAADVFLNAPRYQAEIILQ